MKIVNIFEKKQHLMLVLLFLFNTLTIFLFSNYLTNDSPIIVYLLNYTAFSLYMIYCIFIESSFENNYFRLLQIKLIRIIRISSLIGLISVICLFFYYIFLIYNCAAYHSDCPFLLKNFDYKIHARRRCELSNINLTNTFPYQYICSSNEEKNERNCSKVEKLIENNEIIDEFLKEYYNEENLYYCNLKKQPSIFKEANPKLCDAQIKSNPAILIFINFYLCIRCFFLIYNYFRYITPNINYYENLHLL